MSEDKFIMWRMIKILCVVSVSVIQTTCYRLPCFRLNSNHVRLFRDDSVRLRSISGSYIDISPDVDGGILKKILRKGNYANGKAFPGDVVEIGWKLYTHDGTFIHDSDSLSETFDFTIGRDEVIEGWEIAVQDMFEGEIASLTIQPEYAFGVDGALPLIQPREVIKCELRLIRILPHFARVYKKIGENESIRDELMGKLYDGGRLLLNDPPKSIDLEESLNAIQEPTSLDCEDSSSESDLKIPSSKNAYIHPEPSTHVSSSDSPWRNSSTTAKTIDSDKTRVYFDPSKHKVNPNLIISGTGQRHTWQESNSIIDLEIPLEKSVPKEDLNIFYNSTYLRVSASVADGSNTGEPTGGLPVVLLEGPLHGKIIPSQTVWTVIAEESDRWDGRPKITISLFKRHAYQDIWATVFDRDYLRRIIENSKDEEVDGDDDDMYLQ